MSQGTPVRRSLTLEIAVLLLAKLLLLCGLYIAFFDPGHRPSNDAGAVTARLLGTAKR